MATAHHSRRGDVDDHQQDHSRIVQPSYLEKYQNDKKNLLRRLRSLAKVLETDESIEPDSQEWPGLAATSTLLVEKFVEHKDKEVRLYATLSCTEILAIYAPECPFDEPELLAIFRQLITQLANLAHTTDPSMRNYKLYFRILELIADVKIGVVLVEMTKTMHDEDQQPLELLTELIHTLLQAVRNDHPDEIPKMVQAAMVACLNEYEGHSVHQHAIPIPLLDELLLCIGQGPTQWVINPNPQAQAAVVPSNKKNKNQHQLMVEQPNPSFVTASAIIRTTMNRLANPISQLLNGLLNGDAHVVELSSIQSATAALAAVAERKQSASSTSSSPAELPWPKDSVYTIIYELHRVAPQILTTVIGTVSTGLTVPDSRTRTAVTELLGRLFCASTLPLSSSSTESSSMACQFHAHFREWIRRHLDVHVPVRQLVVHYCVLLQKQQSLSMTATANNIAAGTNSTANMISDQANAALIHLTKDPAADVRLDCIFKVSDWVFRMSNPNTVSPALLRAVGSRVQAKNKEERKSAATGLGQIYFRHYVTPKLEAVQVAGDDCDLGVVVDALHATCHLDRGRGDRRRKGRHHNDNAEEMFGWIPQKIFQSVFYSDHVDTEMRSRVVQLVDEVMLGSQLSSSKSRNLTPTARAVGLTMVLDSLAAEGESILTENGCSTNAFKLLEKLFRQRAKLQTVVGEYIDARAEASKEGETGTEEALVADAKARQLLIGISNLTAPVTGSGLCQEEVLQAFHGARDRRIFRILSTIVDPLQQPNTRARALEELPKRTKSLGDAVSTWVKNLVRRLQMGDFINGDNVGHCVLLAQECFFEKDIPACAALLGSVKTAVSFFPSLCAPAKTFSTLTELLSECLAVTSGDLKKDLDECGIVTALSSILSRVSPKRSSEQEHAEIPNSENLQSQLLKLCTRNGTPEQARNAVYTLVRLLVPAEEGQSLKSPERSRNPTEAFSPILKALTSPSRMTISAEEEEKSPNVVSILSALAALAERAPEIFVSNDRGRKAIKFALETILMGRGHAGGESSDEDADTSDEEADDEQTSRRPSSATKRGRGQKRAHAEAATSLFEDENLSVPCRRVCAAIDFVVSFIRSSLLFRRQSASSTSTTPSSDFAAQVNQIFSLLTQILCDKGLPPSNRDRRSCKARHDRGALRQCAATYLLRLCDPRLGLEKTYLSPAMWHVLGGSFLDEEFGVREKVLEEFSAFLSGSSVYGLEGSRLPPQAPSLRFVAFIALCSDGDHGLDNDASNGNAANMGKQIIPTKQSAFNCVVKLRRMGDALSLQFRSAGTDGEIKFENQFKQLVMPEYMVPFAFHLLSLRRETPCVGAGKADEEGEGGTAPTAVDDESQHRVLRKRLKLLFEPLVQSLGESADNITFLLRMSELLGKNYCPVDAAPGLSKAFSSAMELSIGEDSSMDTKPRADGKRTHLLEARLKTVCLASREVLLSFVKTSVNLTAYAGTIQLPNSLFHRTTAPLKRRSPQSQNLTLSSQETGFSAEETVSSSQDANKKRKLSPTQSSLKKQGSAQLGKSFSPLASEGSQSPGSAKKSRVHFSPEVEFRKSTQRAPPPGNGGRFGGLSPIPRSRTPGSEQRSGGSSSEATGTLGSTPPSGLRGATMHSTAPDIHSGEKSPVDESDDSRSQLRSESQETTPSSPSDSAGAIPKNGNNGGLKQSLSQYPEEETASEGIGGTVPKHINITHRSAASQSSSKSRKLHHSNSPADSTSENRPNEDLPSSSTVKAADSKNAPKQNSTRTSSRTRRRGG